MPSTLNDIIFPGRNLSSVSNADIKSLYESLEICELVDPDAQSVFAGEIPPLYSLSIAALYNGSDSPRVIRMLSVIQS